MHGAHYDDVIVFDRGAYANGINGLDEFS